MGMTRKERFKRKREIEKAQGIGGSGLKVGVSDNVKCDECGNPSGTLYKVEDRMVCINHVPGEMTTGKMAAKLLRMAASGSEAISRLRKANG
jgi:hypothetical protein